VTWPVRVAARPVAVVWGVTLVTFLLMNALPGNAAQARLGITGTPAETAALTARLGLRQPLAERYLHWAGDLCRGRLGISLASGQPVAAVLGPRLAVSAELLGLALVLAAGVALPVAMLSAAWPGGVLDRTSTALGVTAISVAPFLLGLVLMLVFAVRLGWVPALGFVPPGRSVTGNLRSLALPVLTLGLPLAGTWTRVLRSDLLEEMQAEYIVTVRAAGASRWHAVRRHALRNALPGAVTLVGLSVGTLLGASVAVEQVFALPGLGSALVTGVETRDTPLVEIVVLLLAVGVVLAGRLADRVTTVLGGRAPA
jgi:peptide/nickel transport system permease protein